MWNQPNGDNMGYYKDLAIEEQQRQDNLLYASYFPEGGPILKEQQEENEAAEKLIAEQQAAQEEAYYWYCLQEFTALCKIFGLEKVHADLKTLREHVEGVKEEPRIITCC